MLINTVQLKKLKILLHFLCFLPLLWIVYLIVIHYYSVLPTKEIRRFSGFVTLSLLLISLLVSPLARYLRAPMLVKCRRLLGIWCFIWASIHLLCFALLTMTFNIPLFFYHITLIEPHLGLGFLAWLIMLPLTLTSTDWAQKKLGTTWQKLHNWIYLVPVLAIIHYLFSAKTFSLLTVFYSALTLFVLILRWPNLIKAIKKHQKKHRRSKK